VLIGGHLRLAQAVATPLSTRPFKAVFVWQAAATVIIAAIAGAVAGVHGALSGVLGGLVNLSAGVVYAFVLALAPGKTPGAAVVALFRAEACKILAVIAQLWLVLATYKEAVVPAFLAAFVVTVLLFRVALFVRD
jgi:ATP synthase protein I